MHVNMLRDFGKLCIQDPIIHEFWFSCNFISLLQTAGMRRESVLGSMFDDILWVWLDKLVSMGLRIAALL